MTEVFHVASRLPNQMGQLDPGHTPGTVLTNVTFAPSTYPGVTAAVARRFPQGVSSHGARYLAGWPGGDSTSGYVAEAVCEAIRMAEHPDKPSRMVSWFASDTPDDARAFIAEYRKNVYTDIWRAEGEVVHRGNMGLLTAFGLPVVTALERASAYWRGEQGPAPAIWELVMAPGLRLLDVVETTAL